MHPTTPSDKTVWNCPRIGDLLIEQFDGEYILYNRLSGETHVLNTESFLILDAISATGRSPKQIVDLMTASGELSVCANQQEVAQHLEVLERWGIAERTGATD